MQFSVISGTVGGGGSYLSAEMQSDDFTTLAVCVCVCVCGCVCERERKADLFSESILGINLLASW